MRPPWIGLVILIATLVGNAPSGHAYSDSFFNKRYCTMGGGGRSGMADCSYNTWEQCRASASGLGRYCTENPFWKPEGSGSKERARHRRTRLP
jgi:Protein of unknown function (DUF3551)